MKKSHGPLRPTPDAIWCLVIQPQPPSPEPKFGQVLGLLIVLLLLTLSFATFKDPSHAD